MSIEIERRFAYFNALACLVVVFYGMNVNISVPVPVPVKSYLGSLIALLFSIALSEVSEEFPSRALVWSITLSSVSIPRHRCL